MGSVCDEVWRELQEGWRSWVSCPDYECLFARVAAHKNSKSCWDKWTLANEPFFGCFIRTPASYWDMKYRSLSCVFESVVSQHLSNLHPTCPVIFLSQTLSNNGKPQPSFFACNFLLLASPTFPDKRCEHRFSSWLTFLLADEFFLRHSFLLSQRRLHQFFMSYFNFLAIYREYFCVILSTYSHDLFPRLIPVLKTLEVLHESLGSESLLPWIGFARNFKVARGVDNIAVSSGSHLWKSSFYLLWTFLWNCWGFWRMEKSEGKLSDWVQSKWHGHWAISDLADRLLPNLNLSY